MVARLYKELKLIDGEKSSASYYPVDFSSKGNLKIAKSGVSLGNEKIIAFEKVKWSCKNILLILLNNALNTDQISKYSIIDFSDAF